MKTPQISPRLFSRLSHSYITTALSSSPSPICDYFINSNSKSFKVNRVSTRPPNPSSSNLSAFAHCKSIFFSCPSLWFSYATSFIGCLFFKKKTDNYFAHMFFHLSKYSVLASTSALFGISSNGRTNPFTEWNYKD